MSVAPAEKGHSPYPSSERAFYGFACYLSSYLFLIVYLLWAVLPDYTLHAIGFTYYPQKYWAVALPTYLCLGVVTVIVLYFAANMLLVPSHDDIRNLTDSHALSPPPSQLQLSTLPPMYDIPIADVNRAMFGE